MVHTSIGNDAGPQPGPSITADGPDSIITLPDADLLLSADYKRSGLDLVLSGHDGRKFVVHDYFKWDKQPALRSPDGATLNGDLVDVLAGPEHPGVYAQAAPTPGPAPIGRVEALSGNAVAVRGGVVVQLNMGDVVYQNDVIQTGSDSSLGIALVDGSAFRLTSSARMVLNELVYDPNGNANSSLINLVQGSISFVAGQVAHTGDMKVQTPVATMGIRGTAVSVTIALDVNGNATSVTLSMMDNGVANIYNNTGQLIGTLTNNGNVFSIQANGILSQTLRDAGKTLSDQDTFNALQSVVNAFNANPVILTPTPQQQQQQQTPDSNPRGELGTHTQIGVTTTPVEQFITALRSLPTTGLTVPTLTPADATHQPDTITLATLTQTNTIIPPPTIPPTATIPAITSASPHATLNELPKVTGSVTNDQATGTLTVAQVNPGSTLSVGVSLTSSVWSHVDSTSGTTTPDLSATAKALLGGALAASLPAGGNATTASVGVAFDIPDKEIDFLAEGDTLTLTYRVSVTESPSGAKSFQDITITLVGTNDLPVITSPAPVLNFSQLGAPATGGTSAAHTLSRTLSFADPDFRDTHIVNGVFYSSVGAIPQATLTDLSRPGTFTATIASESTDGHVGAINWTFSLPDTDLAFLGAGETATVTYLVQLADGNGGQADQFVTLTMTGTNDVPVITSDDPQVTLSEFGPGVTASSAPHLQTGALYFTDADFDDTHVVTGSLQSAIWSGGTVPAATLSQLSDPDTFKTAIAAESTNDATGRIGWTFNLADQALDFLAVGETLTITYRVQLDDHNGGHDEQLVTFTVTGTNDQPQFTPHATIKALPNTMGLNLFGPSISADGNFVAFDGADKIPGNSGSPGNVGHVYFYDRTTGTITQIDPAVAHPGEQFTGASISFDGRFAVFQGNYTSTGDENSQLSAQSEIFIYDRDTGLTTRLEDPTTHTPISGGNARINANGQFIAIEHGSDEILIVDRNGTIINTISANNLNADRVFDPGISASGTYVAFEAVAHSQGSIGGHAYAAGATLLYVFDRAAGTPQALAAIAPPNASDSAFDFSPTLSSFGGRIAFTSTINPITGLSTGVAEVYVYDQTTHTFTLVSGVNGVPANGASFGTQISADGNTVSFSSTATNLVTGAVTSASQAQTYIYDLTQHSLRLVSITDSGTPGDADSSLLATVTGKGAGVAFGSTATNLGGVPNLSDIFLAHLNGGLRGAVTEDVNRPTATLTTSGAIAFSDVDLDDSHTVSVTRLASTTDQGQAQGAAIGTFTPSVSHDTTGSGANGTISWTYQVSEAAVEAALTAAYGTQAALKTLDETFRITISDGHGGTTSQIVTVSIVGTQPLVTEPIFWTHAGGGDFATPLFWSSASIPGAIDDVGLIDLAGNYTVTSSVAETVHTLATIATTTIEITANTFTISGGTGIGGNAGTIKVDDGATLRLGGTVVNAGSITLNAATESTDLVVLNDLTLSGHGHLTLSDSGLNAIVSNGMAVTFTNIDNTISGAGTIGDIHLALFNKQLGVINATGTTALIIDTVSPLGPANTIPSTAVLNAGTIEATGVGGLTIRNTTIVNTNDDNTLGDADHQATGLIEVAAGSHIVLQTAAILHGTVTTDAADGNAAAGEIDTAAGTVNSIIIANGTDLSGRLNNAGKLVVVDNSALTLVSTANINNSGSIELRASGDATTLFFDQPFATLDGGGEVVLSNDTHNTIAATAGAPFTQQLTNLNNTISGAGTIGANGLVLVNAADGVINANASNALILDPQSLTNSGLIEATNGGTLAISNTTVSNTGGTIDVESGARLTLSGARITGNPGSGTANLTNAGTVEIAGAATLQDDVVDNTTGSIIQIDDGTTLTLSGVAIHGGTINDGTASGTVIGTDTEFGSIDVTGSSTISGASLNNGGVTVANGITLTLDDDTVTGTTFTGTSGSIVQIDDGATLALSGVTILGGTVNDGTASGTVIGTDTEFGSIDVTGSSTISGASLNNGGVTVANGVTLTLDDDAVTGTTFTGTTGSIIQIDDGTTLTLSGVTIHGGTVNDGTTASGAIIQISGSSAIDEGASLNHGSVTVQGGQTLTFGNATVTGTVFNDTASGAIIAVDHGDTLALSGVTIHGGTVNDGTTASGAIIQINGSSTIDEGASLNHGSVTVQGGQTLTFGNATVTGTVFNDTASGAIIAVDHGDTLALSGVTIHGGTVNDGTVASGAIIQISGSSTIDEGASLNHGSVTVQGGQTLTFGNATVAGTVFNDTASGAIIAIDHGDTLALSGVTIHGGTINDGTVASGAIIQISGSSTIDEGASLNHGSVTVQGGQTLTFGNATVAGTVFNDTASGAIIAIDHGDTLALSGVTIHGGTINDGTTASGAIIQISGSSAIDEGASLNHGSVTVQGGQTLTFGNATVTGTVFNDTASGAIIGVDDGDTLALSGVTIHGGTINDGTVASGAIIQINGSSTIDEGASLNHGSVTVQGGQTLTFGNATVTGTVFNDTATGAIIAVDHGDTLALSGVTIHGGTINDGTVASGAIIQINGSSTIDEGASLNHGSVTVQGGQTLTFGNATVTGTVFIDTASGAIIAVDHGDTLALSGVTIHGGTVNDGTVASGALIQITVSSTLDGGARLNNGAVTVDSGQTLTLDDVTVDKTSITDTGNIAIGGTVYLQDGAKVTGGMMTVGAIGDLATLQIENGTGTAGATLDGVMVDNAYGTIQVDGSSSDPVTLVLAGGTKVTGGAVTVSAAGIGELEIAAIPGGGVGATLDGVAVANAQGTIRVDVDGTLVVSDDTAIRGGSISVGARGILDIAAASNATLDGVTVNNESGVLNHGTVQIDATGVLTLKGGATITGGTISDAGTIEVAGSSTLNGGATLDGGGVNVESGATLTLDTVTIDGTTIDVARGGAVELVHTIGNAASIELTGTGQSGSADLLVNGAVTLQGGGHINLLGIDATTDQIVAAAGGGTLTNIDNTISGSGSVGQGDGTLVLQNDADGIIDATGILVLNTGAMVTNLGLLEATGGGTLQLKDGVDNSGTIKTTGGTILIDFSTGISDTISASSGGIVIITNNSVGAITGSAFGTNAQVSAIAGTITLENDSTFGDDASIDVNDIGTALTIDASSFGDNVSVAASGGSTFTITDAVFANGDSIALSNGTVVVNGAAIVGSGTLTGTLDSSSASSIEADAALDITGLTTGALAATVDTGATLVLGAVNKIVTFSTVTNDGVIEIANNGTLDVTGTITGGGSIKIDAGAKLQLDGADSQTVLFSGPNGGLLQIDTATFDGQIEGLGSTDKIDLQSILYDSTATTAVYVGNHDGGVLTISHGTDTPIGIHLLGDYLGAYFMGSNDGNGHTLITVKSTDDAPVVASGDTTESGAIAETEGATGVTSSFHTQWGTIHFTDADLTDRPTAIVSAQNATWLAADGTTPLTLSADQLADIEHAFSIAAQGTNANSGGIGWTYSIADSALDFLGQNETVTLASTVQIADHHGDGTIVGTTTATVTVTITGKNDLPTIDGAPVVAGVTEDGNGTTAFQIATGTLIAQDADHNATQTWKVVGGTDLHPSDYSFAIDNLSIVRPGSTVTDDFSSAPVNGGGLYSVGVNGTPGTLTNGTELNGRSVVYLDATHGVLTHGTGSTAPFLSDSAIRLTGTDPGAGTTLAKAVDFTVEARFDLIVPDDINEAYGIRLTDRQAAVPVGGSTGDDALELRVAKNAAGGIQVQFRDIDFTVGPLVGDTPLGQVTSLQNIGLNTAAVVAGEQIVLRLTHVAGSSDISASYDLLDSSGHLIGTSQSFTSHGTIFSDEDWTQVQIHASSPTPDNSYLTGTYGTLTVDQTGAWSYSLLNGSSQVQALAAGQVVQDHFQLQVTDDQNASTTQTVTINVSGTNDAPTLNNGTLASIDEDTANPAGQTIAAIFSGKFHDADINTAFLGTQFAGIAIGANPANPAISGAWQYNANTAGSTWHDIGAVTAGTALVLSASASIRFVPNADYNGTPPSLSVFAIDNSYADGFTSDTVRSTADLSASSSHGGSTAFAATFSTLGTNIIAVHDAPVLDALNSLTFGTVDEDAGAPTGQAGVLISSLIDLNPPSGGLDNVTDADGLTTMGLAIVGINTTDGTLWYSADNGAHWVSYGSASDSSAILIPANSRLYYQAATDFSGTINDAITIRAWDQSTGAAGSPYNITANGGTGGTTAFSSATDTVSITVNSAPINAGPAVDFNGSAAGFDSSISIAPDDQPHAIFADVTIADASSATLDHLTVSWSGRISDGLYLASSSAIALGAITTDPNTDVSSVVLTGVASINDYVDVLKQWTLQSLYGHAPTFTLVANDGTADSAPATVTVTVAPPLGWDVWTDQGSYPGDWTDPENWTNTFGVPTASDTAYIGGFYHVDLDIAGLSSNHIQSLFTAPGVSLAVTTSDTSADAFVIDAALGNGGTITVTNGAEVEIDGTASSYDTISVSGYGWDGATAVFSTIDFKGEMNNFAALTASSGGKVSFAAGADMTNFSTISAQGVDDGYRSEIDFSGNTYNEGNATISATGGGKVSFDSDADLTNSGAMTADGGDSYAQNVSEIDVSGALTNAGGGVISAINGGFVDIEGGVTNDGSILSDGALTGSGTIISSDIDIYDVVDNDGTISATHGGAINFQELGTVTNLGTISADGSMSTGNAPIASSIEFDGYVINRGTISASDGGSVSVLGGDFTHTGVLAVTGGIITVDAYVVSDGASHGTATIDGGTLQFNNTADVDTTFLHGGTQPNTLVLDHAFDFTGSISGLMYGDVIDFAAPYNNGEPLDVVYTSTDADHGTLIINDGGVYSEIQLSLVGNYTLSDFHFDDLNGFLRLVVDHAPTVTSSTLNATAPVNFVTNGDFATNDFTDWILQGSASDNHVDAHVALFGESGQTASLSQTLGTQAGHFYQLTFSIMNDASGTNSFSAEWSGSPASDDFPISNAPAADWATYTISDLQGANAVLSFIARNDSGDWHLGNISVLDEAVTANGTIAFGDADGAADTHPVSIANMGDLAGYDGDFSLEPVNEANGSGTVNWHFSMLDPNTNSQVLSQHYDIQIADQFGATAVQTVNLLVGTHNGDTIESTSANEVMIGGLQNDTFQFSTGFGHDTITDFNAGTPENHDTIAIDDPNHVFANEAAVIAAAQDDGSGNTVITVDSHDSITLLGVAKAQLIPADFHLNGPIFGA